MQVTMIRMKNRAGTYSWFHKDCVSKHGPVHVMDDVVIEEFDPEKHKHLAACLAVNPEWEWINATPDPDSPPRFRHGRHHSEERPRTGLVNRLFDGGFKNTW
jgi:hypothetical protein